MQGAIQTIVAVVALLMLATIAERADAVGITAEQLEQLWEKLDAIKKHVDIHSDKYDKGEDAKHALRNASTDGRTFPKWSVVVSRTSRGLGGQSSKYRAAFRGAMSEKITSLGSTPSKGSMQDAISQYAQRVLFLKPSDLQKNPSQESYLVYQNAMRSLRAAASQKVLEKEVDENEVVARENAKTASVIKKWTYAIMAFLLATLFVLSLGFGLWFCWVARRKRKEDADRARREENRAGRGMEMRIADQVAREVGHNPILPSAPLLQHHASPRESFRSSR